MDEGEYTAMVAKYDELNVRARSTSGELSKVRRRFEADVEGSIAAPKVRKEISKVRDTSKPTPPTNKRAKTKKRSREIIDDSDSDEDAVYVTSVASSKPSKVRKPSKKVSGKRRNVAGLAKPMTPIPEEDESGDEDEDDEEEDSSKDEAGFEGEFEDSRVRSKLRADFETAPMEVQRPSSIVQAEESDEDLLDDEDEAMEEASKSEDDVGDFDDILEGSMEPAEGSMPVEASRGYKRKESRLYFEDILPTADDYSMEYDDFLTSAESDLAEVLSRRQKQLKSKKEFSDVERAHFQALMFGIDKTFGEHKDLTQ